ncbi:MAG: efflux RND transporter periplasmic adaptor subunit, partial [Kiloniellales bacterium]
TRTVRLVPEFGATGKPLAAAQSVTLHVPADTPRNVLAVHKDAIIKRGAESLVFVVRNDSAELRPVRLGEAVGSRIEVLEGLQDGDLVVVRGNERLQPGDKVSIDKES